MLTEREIFITLVDNDLIQKSDAIILLEGDGFNRYNHAVDLYLTGFAPRIVFSGGITNHNYGSIPFDIIKPLILSRGVKPNELIHEYKSGNTKEQADNIIEMAIINGWKKLILVASPYHQYRAYLTFLKSISINQSSISLFNSSAKNLSWFFAEKWGTRIILINQEFSRIDKYSEFGHLATFSEAIIYQKWKEMQK